MPLPGWSNVQESLGRVEAEAGPLPPGAIAPQAREGSAVPSGGKQPGTGGAESWSRRAFGLSRRIENDSLGLPDWPPLARVRL